MAPKISEVFVSRPETKLQIIGNDKIASLIALDHKISKIILSPILAVAEKSDLLQKLRNCKIQYN